MSKNILKKTVNRNEPVAAKPVRRSVTVGALGACMPPERKRRKMNQEGKDLLAAEAKRGLMTGGPWVQVQSNKKKGVKQKRPVGWGASAGSII